LEMGGNLTKYFPKLALNLNLTNLSLPSSQDYGRESLVPSGTQQRLKSSK
jgi:hypothetical protein